MADLKQISMMRKRRSLLITRSLTGGFSRIESQVKSARSHYDLQPFVKKVKNNSPDEGSPVGYNSSSVYIEDLRLTRAVSPSYANKIAREPFENGGFKKLDVSNEDFVQSTPPDAEIFGVEPAVERNGIEFSDQKEKKQCEKGMGYSMKSVIKPCSRARLFKTPGSFSYRRLLPYLMDIEKGSSGSQSGQCRNSEKGFEDKHLSASNGPETLPDKTTSCSLEIHNTDSGNSSIATSVESFVSTENESSSMPLVNGEIQKLELRASCEDQDLNCSKKDSSTIGGSHFNQENLVGVVSGNKTMTDGEVAKPNVEYPCNAGSLEVLDQTLSTLNDKPESCDYKVAGSSKADVEKSENEWMLKATIFDSFECQHLNAVDPTSSEMGGNRKCSSQQSGDNDGQVLEQKDLNGECMSTAPPDSDMPSKCAIDDSKSNTVDHVSQAIDQVTQKSTNETLCRNNAQDLNKNPDSSPKSKMVPNPHLHLKLSKITGSFSYRRLLPYLINITSHNSLGALGNIQSLKVEKCSKEKPLSPFSTSGKDTCTETFNGESHPVEHHTGDDIKLPAVTATATCSSNHKVTQSPNQVPESPMIIDSRQEPPLLVKPSASDTNRKEESRPKDVVESPVMSSSSLIDSGLLPREDAKLTVCQLPLETEEDCIKSTEKCVNHERQIEADNLVEASITPAMQSASLQKRILKRNPRGCRGICTCLNCSSFRLHAERSFEFSRNQMQDAEEVALDLIKQISCLRNKLEKSAMVAKDQTDICIDQIKEACKKASGAEERAKACLSEMNYHLSIHCRIPSGQR